MIMWHVAVILQQMRYLSVMVQKSDSGNIGDIFSVDNKIAVCDPVYPVYVDTNAYGRTEQVSI